MTRTAKTSVTANRGPEPGETPGIRGGTRSWRRADCKVLYGNHRVGRRFTAAAATAKTSHLARFNAAARLCRVLPGARLFLARAAVANPRKRWVEISAVEGEGGTRQSRRTQEACPKLYPSAPAPTNRTRRPALRHAHEGFGLTPICRKCWHNGPTMTPAEAAHRFGVPMTTPVNQVASWLVCRGRGARQGYFQLENPHVRSGNSPSLERGAWQVSASWLAIKSAQHARAQFS